MEPLWDLCPQPLETCGPLPLPLFAGNLGPEEGRARKRVGQSRLRPCRVIRMMLDLHPCRALVLISFLMATAEGHGQLALFVFAALQLLVADSAGVSSALVGIDEREEVSSGLEVPGPEAVREFA